MSVASMQENFEVSNTSQGPVVYNGSSVRQDCSKNLQFACLYTKHKTQKRKVWQDGRLRLSQGRAMLYDANPPPGSGDPVIDQCELTQQQRLAINDGNETLLEMEKFLVTVDGPWHQSSCSNLARPQQQPSLQAPSASMNKVLKRKYQKPGLKVPPPPSRESGAAFLAKRKRPLQPGELHRQYYGESASQTSTASTFQTVQPFAGTVAPPVQYQGAGDQIDSRRMAHPSYPAMVGHPHALQIQQPPAPPQQQQRFQPMQQQPPQATVPVLSASAPSASFSDARTNSRPPRQQAPNTGVFESNNGFDPSDFFGNDDEEEEDEEEEGPSGFACRSQREEVEPLRANYQTENHAGVSSQAVHAVAGSTLSTNDLLDLFGGEPNEIVTENKVKESSQGPPADDFALPPQDDSSSSEEEDE